MTKTFNKLIKCIVATAMFAGVAALSACGPQGDGSIDYVHNGSVKLKLDYKNHDFFEDGIGQVEVLTYIDGDTTHFKNVYGDTSTTLKARYYGIDTPESTGAVQPFGKKASKYTQSKLEKAAANGTIVVSSPFSTAEDGSAGVYDKPKTDSTGSRYLSLVWINETVKNAPVESLVLLNLWIVQDGLSWAKNTSDVPAYKDTFSDAMNQAERLVRGLWAEYDPDFNYGEYLTTTLYDIKKEVMTSLVNTDPDWKNQYDGAKVRITGVVSGFVDRMLYLQERFIFDKETGEPVADDEYDPEHPENYIDEWAGINVFCGMTPINGEYTKVGTYLEVCGVASDSETFGFQISGTQGHWPAALNWKEGDDNCKIILSSTENDGVHALKTFEYSAEDLNDEVNNLVNQISTKDQEIDFDLFCRTKVNEPLICTDAYLNGAGDELTLNFEGYDFTAYVPFGYHGNPDDTADSWMNPNKVVGKSFELSGVFSYHKNSSGEYKFQIIVCGDNDLKCVTDKKGTVRTNPLTIADAYDVTYVPSVYYYFRDRATSVKESTIKTISQVATVIDELEKGKETKEFYAASGTIKSIDTAWDKAYSNITITVTDGSKDIVAYRAKVLSQLDGASIAVNKSVTIVGRIKNFNGKAEFVSSTIIKYDGKGATVRDIEFEDGDLTVYANNIITTETYTDSVINGSIITLFGVPVVKNNEVDFNGASVMSAYPKGQTPEDPIGPAQAAEIAGALEAGTETSSTYYIEGSVKEITVEYDAGTKRISFIITADGSDFLITGAKFASGLNYEDLTVGKEVLVRSVLAKLADGTITTRQNGCQVQSIK